MYICVKKYRHICTCRITEVLGSPMARVRPHPPCEVTGQTGQQIELRFNSIPPPPAPASGSAVSADTIKDWILDTLEALAPAMCTDPAFVLRIVRRSMSLEGNVSALQTFSLTVLLPFGDWITAFLRGQLSLGPGSYCTVAPFGTHIEAELTPRDHAVFLAIRLSSCHHLANQASRRIMAFSKGIMLNEGHKDIQTEIQ